MTVLNKLALFAMGLCLLTMSVSAQDWLAVMPDHSFYGFQRMWEGVEYTIAQGEMNKVAVRLKHTEKRMMELEYVYNQSPYYGQIQQEEMLRVQILAGVSDVGNLSMNMESLQNRERALNQLEYQLRKHEAVATKALNQTMAQVSAQYQLMKAQGYSGSQGSGQGKNGG